MTNKNQGPDWAVITKARVYDLNKEVWDLRRERAKVELRIQDKKKEIDQLEHELEVVAAEAANLAYLNDQQKTTCDWCHRHSTADVHTVWPGTPATLCGQECYEKWLNARTKKAEEI